MVEIERLSLRLPAGFESRAARIARLAARALSAHALPQSGALALVTVPPLRLDARRSDRALAAEIARGVAAATCAAAGAPSLATGAVAVAPDVAPPVHTRARSA